MVNRRHIRIKVMQSVYAILQSKSDDLTKEEKFLLFNIKKTTELYVLQLLLMVEVRNLALEHIEIKKKKYLATQEDINPNLKFINNRLIQSVTDSPEIKDYVSGSKLIDWKENREYVRILLDELIESELYKDYLNDEEDSFYKDRTFILEFFKSIVAPNEKLFDYYESLNLSWVDDYPLVNTNVMKVIKQMDSGDVFTLRQLKVKEDDEEFLVDLFRKTILHQQEFTAEIDAKTPNWDTERIADMDMILIKMALTEFLYFPSIPTKVTINEYIEIAKDYSTKKSSYFINGVLDKLLKEYNKSGRLKKIGRGLL
ncbi:transcription antitermination factor NusB [Lutimonas zeaxanthinifaciens]|uniref:transcription antitermination factor NusB n=1 Tax=Lutimonas zeaxanthinifaciens TaxID=3060215 RepID=UPI00265D31FC|nr:transcription antitermination factor NusB [Lutimonas sp. YSD2104]WKK67219.1 transcription antitermination factor NusB [Lutimonas sp. YSD2104]